MTNPSPHSNYGKKKGFVWLTALEAQPIRPGKSWLQEPDTAGHTDTTVREQRAIDSGSHLVSYSHPDPRIALLAAASVGLHTSNKVL